jgi:hypothetical protein
MRESHEFRSGSHIRDDVQRFLSWTVSFRAIRDSSDAGRLNSKRQRITLPLRLNSNGIPDYE